MGSPATTPGRGGGRKADAKGDAKNRKLFHAETLHEMYHGPRQMSADGALLAPSDSPSLWHGNPL